MPPCTESWRGGPGFRVRTAAAAAYGMPPVFLNFQEQPLGYYHPRKLLRGRQFMQSKGRGRGRRMSEVRNGLYEHAGEGFTFLSSRMMTSSKQNPSASTIGISVSYGACYGRSCRTRRAGEQMVLPLRELAASAWSKCLYFLLVSFNFFKV